jgi:hypothetical protein
VFDFGYHTSTREIFYENQIPFKVKSANLECDPDRTDLFVTLDHKLSTVFGCIIQ